MAKIKLVSETKIKVRFSELDPMGVVWHGNYARYFEDGREAFGKEFGLSYNDFYKNELYAPLVSLDFKFKRPVRFNDEILLQTEFINGAAAKIIFNYRLLNYKNKQIFSTGSSVQVFTDFSGKLILTNPPFFEEWKKKYKLN